MESRKSSQAGKKRKKEHFKINCGNLVIVKSILWNLCFLLILKKQKYVLPSNFTSTIKNKRFIKIKLMSAILDKTARFLEYIRNTDRTLQFCGL